MLKCVWFFLKQALDLMVEGICFYLGCKKAENHVKMRVDFSFELFDKSTIREKLCSLFSCFLIFEEPSFQWFSNIYSTVFLFLPSLWDYFSLCTHRRCF